jgi:hypothetical protein
MTTAIKRIIPAHLMHDRYWAPLLTLFMEQPKLQQNSHYIDLDEQHVDSDKLLNIAGPWSKSEKFMLYLALHLYNENLVQKEFNLSDMDWLDGKNKALAFKALKLRFNT